MEVTLGACASLAVLYSAHCWLQRISPAKRMMRSRCCGGRRYGASVIRKSSPVDRSQDDPQVQHIRGLDAAVAPQTLRALPHKIRQVSLPPSYRVSSYQDLDPWSSDLLPVGDQLEEGGLTLRLTDSMCKVLSPSRGFSDSHTQPAQCGRIQGPVTG